MSIESDYHKFMQKMYEWQKRKGNKPGDTATINKRTVRYVGPGHTVVYYRHRTLHIYFKQSKQEFDKKARLRRRHASTTAPRKVDDSIYVDLDSNGNMVYISASGRDASSRAYATADRGKRAITKKKLSRDEYTIEDMRAMLRDDHWEEVCGNKRWNYDPAATVREFNKYLKRKN